MRRREFLAAAGLAGAGSLAGCSALGFRTQAGNVPPLVENRPDAVYIPTHVEGMGMVGMGTRGDYACALTYSYPHRFWTVTGTRTEMVEIKPDDAVHLMPLVWDAKTGAVVPDASQEITIDRDGEQVARLSPWAMLSQPMGLHFGDNVQLPSEGTYDVTVTVGPASTRRTGAYADRDYRRSTFEFTFDFSRAKLNEIMFKLLPEKQGTRGAVPPMEMKMSSGSHDHGGMSMSMPSSTAPKAAELPGTVRGSGTSGDAEFVVTTVDDASPYGGNADETYLAVSPRTPYNRYQLPFMSLSATLTRGDQSVFDDILIPAVDPDLGYHYGAPVSEAKSGDRLTVTVDAPPQLARHEGYETAFLKMPPVELALE
jgi:hypothetical protein